MHDYKDWHQFLSKELCEHMDCLQENHDIDNLCIVEKIAKIIVKLYEAEAYELMFDCLEDCFGYDREEHEFEDKDGGNDYIMYAIYNSYNPARMTRGTPYYPSIGKNGQWMDRDYDRGAMNGGGRYGEYSTDRAMRYPYGEYEYSMMNGYMNAADRSRMNGNDMRSDGRNSDYRNNNRSSDWRDDSRDGAYLNAGRRRDSRGRYTERIYNMADDHDMKKGMSKLSEKQKDEWVSDLLSEDGREGEIFTKQEIESIARKNNIKMEDYDLSTLWAVTNALYSDYCLVLSKIPNANTPSTWVKMAVAFLEDSDSDLTPDQKAAAYFHNIVDAEG